MHGCFFTVSPRVSFVAIYSSLKWMIGVRILGRGQNFVLGSWPVASEGKLNLGGGAML